ncbi:hypothetical protein [Victivallis lenta]|uniref:hypothetical protein n=1 Tax=Victivallis lenta TaxID=2606640 RepID=UPI002352B3F9|nr:hypothetical protein [Victivallis lenta]
MKHCLPLLLCWCLGGFLPLGAEEPSRVPNSEPAVEEAAAPVPEAEAAGEEAGGGEEPVMDIRTAGGKVYKDATVERVTPSGIDIGYLREDGSYAMIGVPLAQLTPELQKHFGYDPEQAKKFEEQLQAAGKRTLEETAESEADRMARVTREIKARLSGDEVKIKPADLRFAIYARRRPVAVVPVERVRSGTVVAVIDDTSELPQLPTLVLIDGLELPEGTGRWSGFLYPTGMHARYRDIERIPVFSDSLDEAQLLLERYLDIYSEFAAAQKENAETAAPPETQDAPPDQAEVAGLDNKGGSVSNNSRNDNLGTERYYYYPYYIGSTYWPVIWWSNNCWNDWPRPRPPRPWPGPGPRPPRPPRPDPGPHPPRPPRPPKPDPGPKPPTDNLRPLPGADRPLVPRPDRPSRPNPDANRPAPGKNNVVPSLSGADKLPVRPSGTGSGISGPAVNRPGRGYQMERNGGFRRVVPSPAPARPSTSPGTNVRPSGIRPTPARPATWSGPSTPFNPPRPAGGHGRR